MYILFDQKIVIIFCWSNFPGPHNFATTTKQRQTPLNGRKQNYQLFYNYYLTPWKFFTSALADGLSLEFEWQQVSSLQYSSQCSGRFQQYCSLDGFHTSSKSLCQSFGDCTKSANYNWYHHNFHVPQFLQFSGKVKVLISLFVFILYCGQPGKQSPQFSKFSFSCRLWLGLFDWLRLSDPFVSQNPRVYASHSPG